jgi:hypothetical protein
VPRESRAPRQQSTSPPSPPGPPAGRSSIDDIIDLYKRDVDRTLLRERLRRTPNQRSEDFESFVRFLEELRGAARRASS